MGIKKLPSIDGKERRFRRERLRSRLFFRLTAALYPLIEKQLAPRYEKALEEFSLPAEMTVLDLATGTGCLAAAFSRRGHAVTGLDFSRTLLKRAARRFDDIRFEAFDLAFLSQKKSRSFDIVAAGFFLHGISPEFRADILANMARLAAGYVVIFDYAEGGGWFVRLIEWFEGPHYRTFAAVPRQKEFREAGLEVERSLDCAGFCRAWLCRPNPGTGSDVFIR